MAVLVVLETIESVPLEGRVFSTAGLTLLCMIFLTSKKFASLFCHQFKPILNILMTDTQDSNGILGLGFFLFS